MFLRSSWSKDGSWWQADDTANAKCYVFLSLRRIISHDNLVLIELIIGKWRLVWKGKGSL